MSQISQPVRIALLAVVVVAAAWFFLLRPHPPSSSSPTPTPTPTAVPSAAAPSAAAPSNNSALPPGVAGLSRAVQHARDALSASQSQAKSAEQANPTAGPTTSAPAATATAGSATSAPAAGAGTPATPSSPTPTASVATTHPSSASPTAAAAAARPSSAAPTAASAAGAARSLVGPATAAASAPASGASAATPATTHPAGPAAAAQAPAQHGRHASAVEQVQQELSQGKVAVILFWNPSASDDQSVRQQLRGIDLQYGNVVTHVATPDQVTAYGTVTTNVSVLGTPTIVIVNPKGQASTLTGLVDAKAIDQAVNDAEQLAGTDQLPQLTAYTPASPRAAYIKRVNQMCTRDINRSGVFHFSPGSAPSAAAAFAWLTSVNGALLSNVLRLSPPATDGAYIDQAVGHERRALVEINAAVAAGAAGQASRERDLLLQAQADDDRAAIMFTTYGLTSCIAR